MEQELIALLERFISFRTTVGSEDEKTHCLDWVEESFCSYSPDRSSLRRGSINGAPYLWLPHPAPSLLFFAHTDVVPANDSQFSLVIDGDHLVGRGTFDMKGNQLPYLMALRDAWKRGKHPPVSLLLTSDEEVAGRSIPNLIKEGALGSPPVAFTPDSGPSIVCEHKGVVWADLTCSGLGCHGAYPWDGKNPLHLLSDALIALRDAFPSGERTDWQCTVTPTSAVCDAARNQVPDLVTCSLDIRFPPDRYSSADDVLDAVQKVLPEGCTLREVLSAGPLHTDPNHPMVRTVASIAESLLQSPVPMTREHGGTDARFFYEAGIPAFLYGPVGGGVHSAHEWVSLSSLILQYRLATELYTRLLAMTTS